MKILIYCPNDPNDLLNYLDLNKDNKETEYHLFVENQDNRIAYEFYTLRKHIKKGMNLNVHIHPPIKPDQTLGDVIEFVQKVLEIKDLDFVYHNHHLRSVIQPIILLN